MKLDGTWNIDRFTELNLPADAGQLRYPEVFSKRNDIAVLDLPIYMPKYGMRLPNELIQFQEAILLAEAMEFSVNPTWWQNHFVYITVDQRTVEPGEYQRRPGCHSDAFLVHDGAQIDITAEHADALAAQQGVQIERTYVIYDSLPTTFYAGPFDLSPVDESDCDVVQGRFDQLARFMQPVHFDPYTMLCLTPFCVHETSRHIGADPLDRTFVKIAISRHQYNRECNTHNDLFDYDWQMVTRDPTRRNHRYA